MRNKLLMVGLSFVLSMGVSCGPKELRLEVPSFQNGSPIPDMYAFCTLAEEGRVTLGPNVNPHLRWRNVPSGTKSLAIICVDTDAPAVSDDVNQEGQTLSKDLPRTNFYHWVLVDISPEITEIPAGAVSNGVTPGGQPPGATEYGRQGLNSYTEWFADDTKMAGKYGGYDGPCPPWNDERIHHYYFRVYALDVPTLDLSSEFNAPVVLQAMDGHILDQTEWWGTYTLNKELR